MRTRSFDLFLVVTATIALAFLALPVLALVTRTSWSDLVVALGDDVALDALVVTLKTSAVAHLAILALGTPTAYLLATKRFRGRRSLIALTELPLVLPPVVAGIALLAAFGRSGIVGSPLRELGIQLPFSQVAVVLAIAFVASPFYVRQAVAAFEDVDPELMDAARSLGAGRARAFARVALPLAAGSLGAGSVLAFARGVGEFGATIIFAGNFPGRTQTMPLAIYIGFELELNVALTLAVILLGTSFLVLFVVRGILRQRV